MKVRPIAYERSTHYVTFDLRYERDVEKLIPRLLVAGTRRIRALSTAPDVVVGPAHRVTPMLRLLTSRLRRRVAVEAYSFVGVRPEHRAILQQHLDSGHPERTIRMLVVEDADDMYQLDSEDE